MPLQRRTQAPQQAEVQLIEEAGESQPYVECRSLVPPTRNAVAAGPGGIPRIASGYLQVQCGGDADHQKLGLVCPGEKQSPVIM